MRKLIVIALAMSASLFLFNGCGDDEGSATSYSYQGAGSYWSVTLNGDGTFEISYSDTYGGAVTLTVNGTYVRYDSGFMKLTVTSASGTDAPSAGEAAYAVEVPGTVFLLKPIGGDSEIIPMIASGTCLTSNFTADWMIATCRTGGGECDASSGTGDFFGVFTWDAASSSGSLPNKYNLTAYADLGSGTVGSGTCSNGVLTVDGGDTNIYLTGDGNAIVHANTGDPNNEQIIFAVQQSSISASSLASKTYAAVGFSQAGDDTFAVNIDFNSGATSATAYDVDESNIETAANGTQIAQLLNVTTNTPTTGFFTADLDDGVHSASNMVCALNGEVLTCIGQDPSDNTKQFSLMGAEVN